MRAALACVLVLAGCSGAATTMPDGGGDGGAAGPNLTPFTNPMPVMLTGWSGGSVMEPFLSRDGGYLFFNNCERSDRPTPTCTTPSRIDDLTFQLHRGPLGGPTRRALEAVASEADAGTFYFITHAHLRVHAGHALSRQRGTSQRRHRRRASR